VWLMVGNKNENTCTSCSRSFTFLCFVSRGGVGVGDGTRVQYTKPGLGDARVSRSSSDDSDRFRRALGRPSKTTHGSWWHRGEFGLVFRTTLNDNNSSHNTLIYRGQNRISPTQQYLTVLWLCASLSPSRMTSSSLATVRCCRCGTICERRDREFRMENCSCAGIAWDAPAGERIIVGAFAPLRFDQGHRGYPYLCAIREDT
jgi:hypothetical protein